MIIQLNLNKHCIQTEIKRQYNKLISEYFKSDPSENRDMIGAKIDLLQHALEDLDFGRLRSTYPELNGGESDDIVLLSRVDKQLIIQINGRAIDETY
ncbi:MAG: hypothetical protein ACKVE4_00485 [Dissulfuribacterales bacterium]